MKKVFLFLALIMVMGVKAQTFDETKAKAQEEIANLNKEMAKINDCIYYLKVTLPERITKDSALSVSGKKYLLTSNNLTALRQEKYFSDEEVGRLNLKKKTIQQQIDSLTLTLNTSTQGKVKKDFESDLPEKMGVYEYRRRSRALNFKVSEKIAEKSFNQKTTDDSYGVGLTGILYNAKLGVGELATFVIKRKNFSEFGSQIYNLKPQEELKINLMPGTYSVQVSCGSFNRIYEFSVDPAKVKHFNGKSCYFAAYKALSDF